MAISYSNVGGAEPSTVTFRAGTVAIARGSTTEQQEILVIGDPQTSNAIARVVAADPVSTEFGLIVRVAGNVSVTQGSTSKPFEITNVTGTAFNVSVSGTGPFPGNYISSNVQAGNSSALTVRNVWSSTAADQPVRAVFSSTSADNPVTISGNSTVLQGTNPWTIAGNSTVIQGTTPWTIAGNSTVIQGTTPWTIAGNSTTVIASGNSSVIITAGNSSVIITAGNSSVTISAVAAGLKINIGSTAAENAVLISGNSTTVIASGNSSVIVTSGNSSVIITSGNSSVTIGAVGAGVRMNIGSTAADNAVVISGNSTVFQGGSPWTFSETMQSSVAPSSGSSGVIVRPVIDAILTTASTNTFAASTSFSVQSSAASIRSYVTAYSITTTNAGPTKLSFASGSTLLWPVLLAAVSSAISGVNLAVSAPAYLFRTKVAGPLSLRTNGSTLGGFVVGVSYFRAP